MPRFEYRSEIDAPVAEVFAWHTRPSAVDRLLPPWVRARMVEREGGVVDGGRFAVEIRCGPLRLRWSARYRECVEGRRLCVEQVAGPFESWLHCVEFLPAQDGRTELQDRVTYGLPGAGLGELLAAGRVQRTLRRVFRFRHAQLGYDLARHRVFAQRGPLTVAVTGASGLVGSSLVAFLESGGHRVLRLVRRPPRPGAGEIEWNVEARRIEARALEGVDAVVHLAGERIAGGWWTEARKRAIRRSRVEGTRFLCEALASLDGRPQVLISASAIGFYGDRGEEPVDEASGPGRGFLPEVARAWEAATEPASEAGIRVVNLRIGFVIAGNGGALAPMLPAFSLGLGGRIGDGRRIMSWIDRDDLIGIVHHALFRDSLRGPVNAVAPRPVTNAEFVATLARVLRRPALMPVPEAAIRTLLGEMGEELLLTGAYVRCAKLEADGFRFLHPDLEGSLRFQLGR